jgi:homospermidine synthase
MHVTMVKKKLADGSDCRKCAEVSAYLEQHGFSDRIDEVVWAHENDPESPGMVLGKRLGIERAPFFVVRDERGETVYRSVLQLIQERFGKQVSSTERARDVDPDDVGGI